jgi:nicotinamidase-related amidase
MDKLVGIMIVSVLAAVVPSGLRNGAEAAETPQMLSLHVRAQTKTTDAAGRPAFTTAERDVAWDPQKTAVVICDMWDDHWCKGAAARVVEMAPAMEKAVAAARDRGVLVVHAPSTCVSFYEGAPARRRAREQPPAKPRVSLATSERWGTAWCWPETSREPGLPIDDTDMGCDCRETCEIKPPWTRQIATLTIHQDRDAILDDGQELVNLFTARGIEHVMIMGVHLNMCVLGRPFGIRQLTRLGYDVVLVRDLTDTMYNSRMRPKVDHFTGTDLVVDHVEKYWCPTITSVDLVGGKPFRFAADAR